MKKNYATTIHVLCLLLLTNIFSSSFATAEPLTSPYVITTDSVITIDGELNEGVWENAKKISDFHQTRPKDHGVPSEKTEVQIARDENFIYVAFRVFDTEVDKLVAKGLIQGQHFFSDDRVAVTLDTFKDRRNSYFFQVNPNGIRREALLGNDYFIDDWDTVWYAESKIYEWGWVGEMAIPLKSIAFDPDKPDWGINFTRISPRRGEEISWSSIDRNTNPSAYGSIENMHGFSQGLGLELNPSISASYIDNVYAGSESSFDPALTSFYNITPFLTAGLTLNTDFSGTEADERQINLNRFSLFFPEKRDFFLRDASIFEFGGLDGNGSPFFSRRIGLSDRGEPLDLEAGLKLSGRAGDWNMGALAIQQDTIDQGADDQLFVGRLTRNVGDESEVGLISTHGDPNSDAGNSLYGVDYTYRNSKVFGDQQLRTNVWFQQTDTDGFDDKQSAYGAVVNYPNYQHDAFFEFKHIEENFNPALGFVSRRGVDQGYGRYRYRHALDEKFWQWIGSRVQYFRASKIDGGLQTEEITLNLLEGFSTSNDFFTFFLVDQTEGVSESFNLPGKLEVPVGTYKGTRYGAYFETGRHRLLQFELEVSAGDFFNGKRQTIEPSIEWRPNRHFFGSLSVSNNVVDLPTGSFTSKLYALRGNVAFNSKWAWLNLVQGDNVSDTVSINSRIRYQPKAGREFFLVFNQTRDDQTDSTRDTSLILKASFNFQL